MLNGEISEDGDEEEVEQEYEEEEYEDIYSGIDANGMPIDLDDDDGFDDGDINVYLDDHVHGNGNPKVREEGKK